jgi:MFS transporter, DHA1 family, inner membrane transport protein
VTAVPPEPPLGPAVPLPSLEDSTGGPGEVRRAIPVITVARLTSNAALRFTPPFIAPIARSLGVPIERLGLALSASELGGLAAPAIGGRLDRASRRNAMSAGLFLIAAATALAATSPGLAVYGVALLAIGIAKLTFDSAMGAWIADRVPYERRGRVVGITETAWAGSLLLVIPVLAVVAQLTSWRVALGIVAVASAGCGLLVRFRLAHDVPRAHDADRSRIVGLRASLPVYVAVAFLMLAAQSVFVVFGAWLEDDLGFSTAAVGGVAFLIGVGELVASTGTIRFTDRLGKPNAVLVGVAVLVPAALGLALWSDVAVVGIVALVALIAGFEFAYVSSLPWVSELHPEARARSIGLAYGAATAGRGVGAGVSTLLYARSGMSGSALLAAASGVVVAVLVTRQRRRSALA